MPGAGPDGSGVAEPLPAGAGLAGFLDLTATPAAGGRTGLGRQAFRAPFHLSKPYWDGRVLQVQVVNATAGILAGDRLELAARVTAGAALRLTTPAATRAYLMHRGTAACRQTLVVESGAWLEYAPEPLCPHRDSDYAQHTRIEVAPGGEAYWVDALAPGRVGRGEAWAWRRLQLTLDVEYAGEPVLRERLDISGAGMARMAAFHGTPAGWLATALLLTPRIGDDSACWPRVRALHGGGCWVGLTRLRRGGWIVRIVAPDGQALRDVLAGIRSILAEELPPLAGDPRKL
jgi:urease accessory protein